MAITDAPPTVAPHLQPRRRFHFDWIPAVFFSPRQAFARIAGHPGSVWFTPILVLTVTGLIGVMLAGKIKQEQAMSGGIQLPPYFENYTPEDQARFMQALQATQGPVFVYVFPALLKVGAVWFGWLLMGSLLHLILTMLGGRGSSGSAMNIVAWASLPYALRDLVQAGFYLNERLLITIPGLSGFAPAGEAWTSLFLLKALALVDIYFFWRIFLIFTGVRATNGLSRGKAASGVIITVVLLLLLQALLGFLIAQASGLTVVRPFFF